MTQTTNEKATPFIPEYIFCADPSMRAPGFALLQLSENGRIRVVETDFCDNSRRKDGHGMMLVATVNCMRPMVNKIPPGSRVTFVRERGFSRFPTETQALAKVAGVCDYVLAKDFSKYL